MIKNQSNSLALPAFQAEDSKSILFLLAIIVTLLHFLLFKFAWQVNAIAIQTQTNATPKPFKLEVAMISIPEVKPSPVATAPKPTPKPEKTSKRPQEQPKPVQKNTEDWAAIAQLINTQPRQIVARQIKTQANSSAMQAVSSAIVHNRPKNPSAIDNFPQSDEHNPSPDYPDMAIFLGYQGTAVVKINISAKGISQGVELMHTSGHKELDASATKALKQWRFTATHQPDSVIVVVNYLLR